ncbi:MAG: TIGR01212 family radical SAM protein [Lachnospiraceae bacterium]|nr:TIGR01212 family radical SAM protein [Lachnospiraceae bacterium]
MLQLTENKVDWLDKPYYSLNAYFKHVYGQKIYKIAVDAGLSCPNRDGSLDTRGCIFCSKGGSGDFAVKLSDSQGEAYSQDGLKQLSVKEQIAEGRTKFNKKAGDRFVIYFQAFTNTYGNPDYLRRIWTEALEENDVVGISIATRPDCLDEEVIKILDEIKNVYSDKFIWVELGLQTIHDKTAEYIRRHYPLAEYEVAVRKLHKLDIPYITHIILGLPGETKEEMLETVFYVEQGVFEEDSHSKIRPFGMKLQLLHVLENTDLAEDYRQGKFKTMEMEEYLDLVIDALQKINHNIVIHRVTGDGPKNILISPTWSGNKKQVLNTLHRKMKEKNARQGDYAISLYEEA